MYGHQLAAYNWNLQISILQSCKAVLSMSTFNHSLIVKTNVSSLIKIFCRPQYKVLSLHERRLLFIANGPI